MNWKIELVEKRPQAKLAIRTRTSMAGLPNLIGDSYQKIMEYLNQLGVQPVEVPYTAYFNLALEDLEVEMGFPVAGQLPELGEIKAGEVPGGWAAVCFYKGPYSGLEPVYNAMFQWLAENDYESTGVYYEYYYNSPEEVPESELLTRVEMPVLRKY